MKFKTTGVCAKEIEFEIVREGNEDIVKNVRFLGGCNGNASGISMLVEGMKCSEVISRLQGISCGLKDTSCPDQLAKALKEVR